ncbi:MAG: hypothetical protein M3Q08_04395 [Pseudomonadota bacterium]|nr:hypothetical protein [Pseudomonadota bacterium]
MKPALGMKLLLLVAACGDPDAATERALAKAEELAAEAGRIECAVEGATGFARACVIERVSGPEGTTLLLHHPGGGFRRLLVTTDGRGVVAADGADPAIVSVVAGNRIEVVVAGDRYRLPAKIKGESR